MASRSLAVVSAGIGQPSATRLLADRLASATDRHLREAGVEPIVQTIELRDHAHDLANNLLTGFAAPQLQAAFDAVTRSDGLIAVSPIFSASYNGLFKLFFDVVARGGLTGLPVLMGATGGTARHSLALEHAFRPLFAYLGAATVPTAVYAAAEDWGRAGVPADASLVERIDRAARELAGAMVAREARVVPDPFRDPPSFEELLRSAGSPPPPARED